MEQILVRQLPEGTKAALKARAKHHHRSVEAEAREILTQALQQNSPSLVDIISVDYGAEVDFEPESLGFIARTPEL